MCQNSDKLVFKLEGRIKNVDLNVFAVNEEFIQNYEPEEFE